MNALANTFNMLILLSIYLSPSNVSGSLSIYNNPSCLGINKGIELTFIQNEKTILFSFYNWGVGLNFSDGLNVYTSSLLLSTGFFGLGLGKTKDASTIFGTYIRPVKKINFGMNLQFMNDNSLLSDIGLSIQPFIENIKLTGAFNIRWPDRFEFSFIEGIYEPTDGFEIKGIYDFKDKKISAGLTVALNRLKISGYGNIHNIKDGEVFYQASFFPYPSIIKDYQRNVIYEISGEYSEAPGGRLIKEGKSFIELLLELKRINESREIKRILFVIKKNSLGIAQAEEIRNIIQEISRTKETYGYSDYVSIKNLYILTACDSIFVPPSMDVNLSGIVVEKTYIKGLLEKIGIEPQFLRIGRYKSAVEIFTADSMSKYDRIQTENYINTVVDVLIKTIADSRNINFSDFNKIIDTMGYITSNEAKELKIVDDVMFIEELKDKLNIKKKYQEKTKKGSSGTLFLPKIALLVIEGNIVQGESSPAIPFLNEKMVGDETIVKIIEKIKKDKSIKGVIIRVNSPGGDVFASSRIRNALLSLKAKKPVIISFGDVAASGGYHISSIGCKIFTDRTTLTGSIGIFMGKFSLEGLYKKIGIKKDFVKFGEHSDAFSDTRKFDNFEIKRIEKILMEYYNDFTKIVSESRNIPQDSVNILGEGRIWSGEDAIKIGLADKKGGLIEAIEEIKRILNIKGKILIISYPKKQGLIDLIMKGETQIYQYFDFECDKVYYFEPLHIYLK